MIQKGSVELVFDGISHLGDRFKKNSLKQLYKGDSFGEFSFFTG